MRAICTAALIASAIGLPPHEARAHHSSAAFDIGQLVGIQGEIAEIRWRNPHIRVDLAVVNPAGEREIWDLEMESPGMLRRINVGPDVLNVGDRVTVVGNPALNGAHSIYVHNVLLPSGEELVTDGGPPRLSDRVVGNPERWSIARGTASHPELGLFRVWSTTAASPLELVADDPASQADPFSILTPAAQRAIAAFDPAAAASSIGCAHKGMPRIMQQPDDMAFVRDGEDIKLLIEEYDTVRRIDMTPDEDRASKPLTTLGYSTGAWEGRTLVVTTTGIAPPEQQWSLPQSEQIETVERFTPSEDGSRLDYELIVTDPVYMTAPIRFAKYWIALEGAEIDPYNCAE